MKTSNTNPQETWFGTREKTAQSPDCRWPGNDNNQLSGEIGEPQTVKASTNTPELKTPARMVPGAEAINHGFNNCNATTYNTNAAVAMPNDSAGDTELPIHHEQVHLPAIIMPVAATFVVVVGCFAIDG